MASRELFYAYKETRLSVEPSSPAAVVHAQVPSANGDGRRITGQAAGPDLRGSLGSTSSSLGRSGFRSSGGDRMLGSGVNAFTDEERFYRAKTLASESGIFHRRHHGSPRSFLWRVLEAGHVLSLRAVDVVKHQADPSATPDAPLTLHLHFPKPIRAGCVAFSDPAQHDALAVFVLDETFYLHHLLLRPDVFRKRALANEADLGEAWKPYLSATLNFKHPRRVIAVSADEILILLHDGGLINFRCDVAH